MNDELIRKALASDDPKVLTLAARLAEHPLFRFKPRPDQPELLDQQASFFNDKFDGLACVLAGNGAGKSYCGAAKVANFLLDTPPPEPNTPFWVLSTTMDLSTSNCWAQNLRQFIPKESVQDTVWYSAARGLPRSVVLRKHRNGNNFVVEFKSYDQSRERLQAANIAGFWADEQAPYDILMEVWARTRKWNLPGSKLYTLTPLQPDKKLEDLYREPPESWRFYRMNTRCNSTLDRNFVRQIEENELAELVETRTTGAFARYEGAIYPNLSLNVHVIEPFEVPKNWLHVRGLDLGWNHATACVWAARDLEGRYFVYREYNKAQTSIEDHVREINDGWQDVLIKGNTYADPAAAQTLYEFSLRGLDTVPANKDVYGGIATVQSLLRPAQDGRPRLYVFKTCETLIQQLRAYVYDPKTGKPKKETPNCLYDLCDAARYLCHSHRLDMIGFDFKPAQGQKRPNRSPV